MSNQKHEKAKVSQSILLVRDKKILILKHKSGKWLLPGGRLNMREKWRDGLLREVEEETGIGNIEITGVLEVDNWENKKDPHYGVFLHGVPLDDRVILSDEHAEFAWVSKDDIQNYEFWNNELRDRVIRLAQKVL